MNTLNRIVLAGGMFAILGGLTPAEALAQQSGAEVWAQTCGNCHAIQPARRYTADQWASIMTHMKIATRMTDAQTKEVLRFLQRGARKPDSAAPARRTEQQTTTPVALATLEAVKFWSLQEPDGARLYSRECKSCHGSRGKGDGRAARTMDTRPTDISDPDYLAEQTDSALAEVIVQGQGEMDPLGNELTEEQIRAVVKYVRRLGELRAKKRDS